MSKLVANPLRYGWACNRPPQYEVKINTNDLTADYKPTDQLIGKLTEKLVRNDCLNKAGFTCLSNFDVVIPKQQHDRFLTALVIKLKQNLEHHFKLSFNPDSIPLTLIKRHMIDGKILKEGNITTKDNIGNWTLKSPHFDRGAFVVMHKYNPTENVTGGHFQVIDVKQFLADNQALKLDDILLPDKQIHPDYWNKLKPYVLTLNTNRHTQTVVIVNNTLKAAVAHSATTVAPVNAIKPFKRDYERYTITRLEPDKTLPPDVIRLM